MEDDTMTPPSILSDGVDEADLDTEAALLDEELDIVDPLDPDSALTGEENEEETI